MGQVEVELLRPTPLLTVSTTWGSTMKSSGVRPSEAATLRHNRGTRHFTSRSSAAHE